MSQSVQIKVNTRCTLARIDSMLLPFAMFAFVSVVPAGLSGVARITIIRMPPHALLTLAVLGGIFPARVAILHKKTDK